MTRANDGLAASTDSSTTIRERLAVQAPRRKVPASAHSENAEAMAPQAAHVACSPAAARPRFLAMTAPRKDQAPAQAMPPNPAARAQPLIRAAKAVATAASSIVTTVVNKTFPPVNAIARIEREYAWCTIARRAPWKRTSRVQFRPSPVTGLMNWRPRWIVATAARAVASG